MTRYNAIVDAGSDSTLCAVALLPIRLPQVDYFAIAYTRVNMQCGQGCQEYLTSFIYEECKYRHVMQTLSVVLLLSSLFFLINLIEKTNIIR